MDDVLTMEELLTLVCVIFFGGLILAVIWYSGFRKKCDKIRYKYYSKMNSKIEDLFSSYQERGLLNEENDTVWFFDYYCKGKVPVFRDDSQLFKATKIDKADFEELLEAGEYFSGDKSQWTDFNNRLVLSGFAKEEKAILDKYNGIIDFKIKFKVIRTIVFVLVFAFFFWLLFIF